MLQPIRRVVTGHDAEGRSVIVSDGPTPRVVEMPFWAGNGITSVWSTSSGPASNADEELVKEVLGFPDRGSGGVSLMFMHIPPASELKDLSPENQAIATMPVADFMPEAMNIDTSRHYGMHATETVDLLIMLKGELTLILDEGEVTLKPFDTVVQRGVNHGWENRGTETALIVSAVIDASPIERKRAAKARETEPARF